MNYTLLSVGIDVGTTTSQIVFSRLTLQNKASAAAVPEVQIIAKDILYRSRIHFTPLTGPDRIDFTALKDLIDQEYLSSSFPPESVQTGAVIITGETARKENAAQVIKAISAYAGDFVVSAAGPDLEAVLAGMGAGIADISKKINGRVVNFDIGGGTTNAAVFYNGEVYDTFALDIGGRLVKFDENGRVLYISGRLLPYIRKLGMRLNIGEPASFGELKKLTLNLASMFLELIALKPLSDHTRQLFIGHKNQVYPVEAVSFSGGIAEFIYSEERIDGMAGLRFNDIGPLLGESIRQVFAKHSIPLIEPAEKIRATVVGAGHHTIKISGSTVTCTDSSLPLRNIPVIKPFLRHETEDLNQFAPKIRQKLNLYPEGPVAIAFQGPKSPGFSEIKQMTGQIIAGLADYSESIIIITEHDFAKALGQALKHVSPYRNIICLDRIKVEGGDYIDIGIPVAGVVPVAVKTLVFNT